MIYCQCTIDTLFSQFLWSTTSHCITDKTINFQSAGKVQKNDKDSENEKASTGKGTTPTTGMFSYKIIKILSFA